MSFTLNIQAFKTYLEDAIAAIPPTEVNSADKMARYSKLLAWTNQALGSSGGGGSSGGLTLAELTTELDVLGATTDPSTSNTVIGLLKAISLRAEADTEIIEWEVKTTVAPNIAGDGIREVLVNGVTTSWVNLRTGAGLTGSNIPAYTNLTKISNTASQLTQAQVLAAIDDSVTLDDIKGYLDLTKGSGIIDSKTLRTTIATDSIVTVKTDQTIHGTSDLVSADLTKINGFSLSTSTGVSGAGTQRVAVAEDSKSQIWDGTNVLTIKAASTSVVATDTAQVVAISPNSNIVNIGADFDAGTTSVSTLRTVTATDSPEIAALGDLNDVTTPATVGSIASLKGLLRFIAGLINPVVSNLGGFATSDLPLTGTRTRYIQVSNNTGLIIYAQLHSKASALTTGDIPVTGFSIRLPANSSFALGVADLGVSGTQLTTNPRLGLSSTFGTYTAIVPTNTSIFAMVVN